MNRIEKRFENATLQALDKAEKVGVPLSSIIGELRSPYVSRADRERATRIVLEIVTLWPAARENAARTLEDRIDNLASTLEATSQPARDAVAKDLSATRTQKRPTRKQMTAAKTLLGTLSREVAVKSMGEAARAALACEAISKADFRKLSERLVKPADLERLDAQYQALTVDAARLKKEARTPMDSYAAGVAQRKANAVANLRDAALVATAYIRVGDRLAEALANTQIPKPSLDKDGLAAMIAGLAAVLIGHNLHGDAHTAATLLGMATLVFGFIGLKTRES